MAAMIDRTSTPVIPMSSVPPIEMPLFGCDGVTTFSYNDTPFIFLDVNTPYFIK